VFLNFLNTQMSRYYTSHMIQLLILSLASVQLVTANYCSNNCYDIYVSYFLHFLPFISLFFFSHYSNNYFICSLHDFSLLLHRVIAHITHHNVLTLGNADTVHTTETVEHTVIAKTLEMTYSLGFSHQFSFLWVVLQLLCFASWSKEGGEWIGSGINSCNNNCSSNNKSRIKQQ